MKTTRRILIGLALGLLLLATGVVAWIAFRGEHFEQLILAQLDASLKTRAHITDMDVNLWDDFPMVSMSLEDVWLAGSGTGGDVAHPFSGDTLLRAERLSLTLDAMSLITGNVQVKALTVSGGTLVLAERPDGQWNTDVWRKDSSQEDAAFEIERLHAQNLRVQINDAGFQLDDMECTGTLDAGRLVADLIGNATFSEIPLFLQAHVEQIEDQWEMTISRLTAHGAQAKGTVVWDEKGTRLQGTFEQLNVEHWAFAFPTAELGNLEMDGELSGSVAWDGQIWKSQIDVEDLHLSLPEGFHTWLAEVPALPLPMSVSGTAWVRFDVGGWRVDVPSVQVHSEAVELNGNLSWTPARTQWVGNWKANAAASNWYPLPEGWDWSGGTVSGHAAVSIQGNGWELDGGIDASRLAGTWENKPWSGELSGQLDARELLLHVTSLSTLDQTWDIVFTQSDPFGDSPLRASLSGTTDRLVIPNSPSTATTGPPWWDALELPPNSEIAARLTVDTLIWEGNVSTHHALEASWSPRRLRVDDAFSLWGGSGSLNGEFRWDSQGGRLDFAYSMQQVDVKRMFREMADFGQTTLRSKHVAGELQSEGHTTLHWGPEGNLDWERIRWYSENEVNGGVLDNVESLTSIPEYLSEHRMAAPLIQPADLAQKLKHIELESIQTPVLFANQTFHIPYLELTSPELHVSLLGEQNLSGEIDYSVGISLRDIRSVGKNDIGTVEDDGLGNHLFIHLAGTLDHPTYKWDRAAQKAHRRKNLQAERERLRELWNSSSAQAP